MSAAASPQYDNDTKILLLEKFLDEVLKKNYEKVYAEREKYINRKAQYNQLAMLINEMKALNAKHSFITDGKRSDESKAEPKTRESKVLVDLGNHFYTEAVVKLDTSDGAGSASSAQNLIHMNIGCGVVLPMTLAEAEVFLKKTKGLDAIIENKTREMLRLRYRIRITAEVIANLHQSQTGMH